MHRAPVDFESHFGLDAVVQNDPVAHAVWALDIENDAAEHLRQG